MPKTRRKFVDANHFVRIMFWVNKPSNHPVSITPPSRQSHPRSINIITITRAKAVFLARNANV